MKQFFSTKKIAYLGVFLALSMIFSYVEVLIPFYFGVPGMKLGLPNAVIVILLYAFGPVEALIVNLLRIFLTSLLFTNVFSFWFSLAGGLISFLVMFLMKRLLSFSPCGTSIFGGVFHNVGQLLVAMVIVSNYAVSFYLPVLLIFGFLTGALNGVIAREILKRFKGFGMKQQ